MLTVPIWCRYSDTRSAQCRRPGDENGQLAGAYQA